MKQGRIKNLVASVSVEIMRVDGSLLGVKTMLDTGFTGFLTLPSKTIRELELKSVGSHWVTLADGSEKKLRNYLATVRWESHPRQIHITCAEGFPLLGMEMLEGHRLLMDVREGGSVRIEPLQETKKHND